MSRAFSLCPCWLNKAAVEKKEGKYEQCVGWHCSEYVLSCKEWKLGQKKQFCVHLYLELSILPPHFSNILCLISFSTKPTKEMHVYQRIAKHTTFVIWAVFSELDMGQWKSHDFWLIMLMMALMWFLRLYLHYCSQWLFLQAISIPVLK